MDRFHIEPGQLWVNGLTREVVQVESVGWDAESGAPIVNYTLRDSNDSSLTPTLLSMPLVQFLARDRVNGILQFSPQQG